MNVDNVIYVDKREKAGGQNAIFEDMVMVVTTEPKLAHLSVKQSVLPCGDFKFRDLGAERKSIPDFIASIHDGRIFTQAFNMAQSYAKSFLLISGSFHGFNERDIKGIYTTIADLQCRYGMQVLFLPDDAMLVRYFAMLCYKYMSELKPMWRFERRLPGTADEQVAVLCGIYKLGRKTAVKLLSHFKTLKRLFSSAEPEIAKHSGAKIAAHFVEVANKKFGDAK